MSQRKMGPLAASHPLVRDATVCPGCHKVFRIAEYVTLVNIGPGSDTDARRQRDQGRAYNAIALPVHWDCSEQRTEETSARPDWSV